MTTTLPALLAELDSAPSGCLDDVRRQLRVVVVAVMEMREAVEDNARLCRHERNPLDGYAAVQECERLRAELNQVAGQRDGLSDAVDAGGRELQRALADVARLTAERDAARDINAQLRREIGDCLTVDMLIKERATVAAEIAAWFERHPEPGQLTRERIVEDIREGRWRKEGM